MKILIVEDTEAKITALRKIMKELGISNYIVARNQEDAQKAYRDNKNFDVMILDMNFPKRKDSFTEICTGREFLKKMEKDYEILKLQIPITIVYSIIPIKASKDGKLPKYYYGQSISAIGVKELLMQII